MPSETDYAWAAGIIDGEGYIGMTRNKAGTNRRTTESFQIRISVRMTHEETIRRLQGIFGGTVKLAKSCNPSRHRSTFEWYVGDMLTVEVLRVTVKYMTTKKDQANLALEFRNNCFRLHPTGRGACCAPEVVALRANYFNRLRDLNKRGVTHAESK